MAPYKVLIAPSALKDIERLSEDVARRIEKRIDALSVQPFPPRVKKLGGSQHTYRVSVGHYRVVYDVDTKASVVLILRVGHRREAYRKR